MRAYIISFVTKQGMLARQKPDNDTIKKETGGNLRCF